MPVMQGFGDHTVAITNGNGRTALINAQTEEGEASSHVCWIVPLEREELICK